MLLTSAVININEVNVQWQTKTNVIVMRAEWRVEENASGRGVGSLKLRHGWVSVHSTRIQP